MGAIVLGYELVHERRDRSHRRQDLAKTLIMVVTHSMQLPISDHVTVYKYRPKKSEITHFRTR